MGLKRKSSGALLRHSDGALMSECCCSDIVPYACTLDACVASADRENTNEAHGNICLPNHSQGTLGNIAKIAHDLAANQVVGETVQYLGWWWFDSKKLMTANKQYQIQYVDGGSLMVPQTGSSDGRTTLHNLNFVQSDDSELNWVNSYLYPFIKARYVVVVQACDQSAFDVYPFPGSSSDRTSPTEKHITGGITVTPTKPSYIGIAYQVEVGGYQGATELWFNGDICNLVNKPLPTGLDWTIGAVTDAEAASGFWPRFSMLSCAPCSPNAVTNVTYTTVPTSTSFGMLSWQDQNGCFDQHKIYLKRITSSTCDCTGVDPSVSPTYTFQVDGNTSCTDDTPTNSYPLSGVAEGKYCVRIDVSKRHYSFDAATFDWIEQKLIKLGTVTCIEVTCPSEPLVFLLSPANRTYEISRYQDRPIIHIGYQFCSSLRALVNGVEVLKLTDIYAATYDEVVLSNALSRDLYKNEKQCDQGESENSLQIVATNQCGTNDTTTFFYLCQARGTTPIPIPNPVTTNNCNACAGGVASEYTVSISGFTGAESNQNYAMTVTFNPSASSSTRCFFRGNRSLPGSNGQTQTIDLVWNWGLGYENKWIVKEAPASVFFPSVSTNPCSPAATTTRSISYVTGQTLSGYTCTVS